MGRVPDDTYNSKYPYGKCTCGSMLFPVWFREKEHKVVNGSMIFTGRTRRAVSHLACTCCLKEYPIDDSFDGPWE